MPKLFVSSAAKSGMATVAPAKLHSMRRLVGSSVHLSSGAKFVEPRSLELKGARI